MTPNNQVIRKTIVVVWLSEGELMMPDRFLLEPEYANFTSREQLKFKTVNDLGIGYLIVLIPFCLMGTILSTFTMFNRALLDHAYLAEGREINASVTDCQMHQARDHQYPQITYSYSVNDNLYQDTFSYNYGSCSSYPIDTRLSVLYLFSNPQESRFIDDRALVPEPILFYLLIFPMNLMMIASLMLVLYWTRNHWLDRGRYRRLKQNGIVLAGELLTAQGKMEGSKARYFVVRVTYSFQTPDGRALTCKQKKVRGDLRSSELPPAGTPVSVLYADDDAVVML